MESRFCSSPLSGDHEENGSFGECNVAESPRSSGFNDMMKMSSASSPKRSRRAIQKRVVSIPIKDGEGSRLKGEGAPPPSDSWAWRKYGQKPIKGSPFPRGYYRCSSSKGCPARKQVERSRDDPTMLLITYSCEHNHPWPAPRNNHHHPHNHQNLVATEETKTEKTTSSVSTKPETSVDPEPEPEPEPEPQSISTAEDKFMDMYEEFGCFATPSSMVFELEGPIFEESHCSASNKNNNLYSKSMGTRRDGDIAMFFPMREEDESLFADLGELPECSLVFRHSGASPQLQPC